MTHLDFLPIESKSLSKITRRSSLNNSIWGDSSNHLTRDIYVSTRSTVDDSFRATSSSVVSFFFPPLPHPLPQLHPSFLDFLSPSQFLFYFWIPDCHRTFYIAKNQPEFYIILPSHLKLWAHRNTPSCDADLVLRSEHIVLSVLSKHSANWAIFQSYLAYILVLLLHCLILNVFPSLFKTIIKSHLCTNVTHSTKLERNSCKLFE